MVIIVCNEGEFYSLPIYWRVKAFGILSFRILLGVCWDRKAQFWCHRSPHFQTHLHQHPTASPPLSRPIILIPCTQFFRMVPKARRVPKASVRMLYPKTRRHKHHPLPAVGLRLQSTFGQWRVRLPARWQVLEAPECGSPFTVFPPVGQNWMGFSRTTVHKIFLRLNLF